MEFNGMPATNNRKALISMISGILSWVSLILIFCFNFTFGTVFALATFGISAFCLLPLQCIPVIGWIFAVITGHLGGKEIKTTGEGGRGMAIAGLVMGYLGLGSLVILILIIVVTLLIGGSVPLLDQMLQ